MELISSALRLEFREFCVGLVLSQIDDIFQLADIQPGTIPPTRNLSGARRTRVEEYYASLDWTNPNDVQKFLKALGLVISQTYISENDKSFVREICSREGLIIEGNQVLLSNISTQIDYDLFEKQFPVGLPFGKAKPNFAITAEEGKQSLKFELKSGMGIIWRDVYPNFDFQSFQAASNIDESTNLALKQALVAMNQTDYEKEFFKMYARHYDMANKNVPMLVPQAWIQWHSLPKYNLRASKSSHADELYRVDFVAFWENQRYAILIDDISHYAVKRANQWQANEESYAKRLKEDRKLQAEGWRVYRVSNWEMRDTHKVKEILIDLQKFMGFQV